VRAGPNKIEKKLYHTKLRRTTLILEQQHTSNKIIEGKSF
jgi:hypothetical protein